MSLYLELDMFDETRLYLTDDPALRAIAPASTLAHWRCENRGPAYIRLGQKNRLQRPRSQCLAASAARPDR